MIDIPHKSTPLYKVISSDNTMTATIHKEIKLKVGFMREFNLVSPKIQQKVLRIISRKLQCNSVVARSASFQHYRPVFPAPCI